MPLISELTYRSDASTDFRTWWLKRRGLAQECAFWVSLTLLPIQGVKSPPPKKNPILVAWIGVFKPNSWNRKTCIYQNYCIDSNQILHSDKDHQMPFVSGPNTHITNPRWWTAAILEKVEKSPYVGDGWTYRHEIWRADAVWPFWPFRFENRPQ